MTAQETLNRAGEFDAGRVATARRLVEQGHPEAQYCCSVGMGRFYQWQVCESGKPYPTNWIMAPDAQEVQS